MSKKYMYLFGAALLALSGVGASAHSVQAKTAHHARARVSRTYNQNSFANSRYFVNAPASISSRARILSGTATRGVRVVLQNGDRTVASTHASRQAGRYTLTVPKRYRVGTNLRVMAEKGYQRPYRIVLVKTPVNQKAAVRANRKVVRKPIKKSVKRAKVARKTSRKATRRAKKAVTKRVAKRNVKKTNQRTAKKVNRKANRKPAVRKAPKLAQTPTGTWTARQTKNYNQKVSFSQARGLNVSEYTKNGRYVKKLVANAPYRVDSIKPDFWKISYKPTNSRKTHVFYMHLLNRNNFEVTNQSGRKANLDFLRA